MHKKSVTIALLLYAVIGLAACATLAPEGVEQPPRDDAIIATKIKAELIEDETLDAAAIRVVSDAGAVTLDGFVDNEEQKRRAETLAQAVDGVFSVDNQLKIR